MIHDRLTESQLRKFEEWLEQSPYEYYDSMDRLILWKTEGNVETRSLHSFDDVYGMFIADTVTDYETKMFSDLSKAIAI